MIFELGVIIGGCVAHMMLSGAETYNAVKGESKPTTNSRKQHEQETFEYFNNLSLSAQEAYFRDNLDLKEYDYLLTDNKWFNAKHAAEIAYRKDKSFNNINKRY